MAAAAATTTSAGPRYAPADPTLPKPWRGLVDGRTGNLYFWNPETNVTQYQRPKPPPQQQSSDNLNSADPSQQCNDDGNGNGNGIAGDDVRHESSGNGESKLSSDTKGHETTNGGTDDAPRETAEPEQKETPALTFMPAVGSGLSPDAYRRRHEITVSGNNVPPPFTSFEHTGFPSELLREVLKAGFSAPTPIQAQSWPIALQNRDIVAVAKTGSGKTLGYLIPGFMHLKRACKNPKMGPTVLVLSPTRELATQIQDEAIKFGKSSKINCTHVEVLTYNEKRRRLEQILGSQQPGSKIIIFCSTKKMCDVLARNLSQPFGAAAIHGDKNQSERDSVLSQFRSGKSPVLVATDVAARGLDVKDIRVVVNYDFPTGVEDYVHRIGRTGRAGATGEAYTFFGDQDAKYASELVKVLEGANQRVPPELREMASRSGGMGGRSRRWNSDGGGGSSFGGRDGGGYGGRGSSRDSDNGGGGGYQSKSFHDSVSNNGGGGGGWGGARSRSRSPERFDNGPPVKSFHQLMMERGRAPPST
ncbi:hypothetical protein M8C21_014697 [Ambrosia artemisiifolia]|uniref:RNA helicase n=1 Tax=Ambrosia artemisiifolia TaxID=4212 RepID=A0AAD5GRY6_AMBAR|nr:hypothetical protein M8C21_014697 [Ambrosia artemisiifolia]